MGKRKVLRRLERDFGAVPDVHYFAGDMQSIASYYDYRRDNKLDDFLLDETTWYDLGMDDVFRRINPGLTTSGEQYLYYMLRHPAVTREDYEGRRALISAMEKGPALRLRLQYVLSQLGRSRYAVLNEAFDPEYHGPGRLLLYIGLTLLFVLSVAAAFFSAKAVLLAVAVLVANMLIHSTRMNAIRRDFDTVNYSLAMIVTLKRIKGLREAAVDAFLPRAYESLGRFRSAVRMGGVSGYSSNEVGNMLSSVFLLDLITYEFLKNKLWRNHDDLFVIHEHLGKLDAAIAAASFKKSLGASCAPELDFSGGKPFAEARGVVHPLLRDPVPNDFATEKSILITGSNASGKSTYLKAAAVCAILAQSLCVTTARRWRASAFRILTSMAVTDDLAAGESYYIAEIKSLRRIFTVSESRNDEGAAKMPVLAVVDEVLRGTNTVERIAASAEVLDALLENGVLCLTATHDIELTALLAGKYALYHFEETIGEDEMTFDYRLRPGPAGSRNAINLLQLMGFDDTIVGRAHERANRYLEKGTWS
jgi:hypothetical protein